MSKKIGNVAEFKDSSAFRASSSPSLNTGLDSSTCRQVEDTYPNKSSSAETRYEPS
jgi:hypothetical protein